MKSIRGNSDLLMMAGILLAITAGLAWFLFAITIDIPSRFGVVNLFNRLIAPLLVLGFVLLLSHWPASLYERLIASTRRPTAMLIAVAVAGIAAACVCFAAAWTIDLSGLGELQQWREYVRFIAAVLLLRVVAPLLAGLAGLLAFMLAIRLVQRLTGAPRAEVLGP